MNQTYLHMVYWIFTELEQTLPMIHKIWIFTTIVLLFFQKYRVYGYIYSSTTMWLLPNHLVRDSFSLNFFSCACVLIELPATFIDLLVLNYDELFPNL